MDIEEPVFVEEITFEELQFGPIVGRGAFGVVSRARWRNVDVAVKLIETEAEKKAFITELKQLSRVNHHNIVKLYGACTQQPVCLVMEYAEGGSLYNVLHGETYDIHYTAAHAMSWCLQCALGVEYLHGMKPKPLIHRDLKPPNLLLVNGGTVLKICDFGTACDAHTHMTNNKGSAAWMAPEVFEGSNYSEKCDVFSWGIILWEVITRRKPFDDIGGPAFRIMWAVHNGTRPPLIKGTPKTLEVLMQRCWSANPVERPDMSDVARVMSNLIQFFTGYDEPLIYPMTESEDNVMGITQNSSLYDTPPPSNLSVHQETVREMGELVPVAPTTPKAKPVVVEELAFTNAHRRTSAPASLAASHENLMDKSSRSSTPSADIINKRFSADLSKLDEIDIMRHGGHPVAAVKPVRGHRRTGSHGTPFVSTGNQNNTNVPSSHQLPVRGHRRTGSHGNTPFNPADLIGGGGPAAGDHVTHSVTGAASHPTLHHTSTAPGNFAGGNLQSSGSVDSSNVPHRSVSWTPGVPLNINPSLQSTSIISDPAQRMAFLAMDHQLQPLAPCPTSPESMNIFEDHCKMAQEYMRMQTEITLLQRRKEELQKVLEEEDNPNNNPNRFIEEYKQLMSENESLALLHKNLKQQVAQIRTQTASRTEVQR